MKLSTKVCVSLAALMAFAMTADGAFAADKPRPIGMTSGGGNKGFGVTDQTQPCPTGETATTNPTTGNKECVKPDAARSGVMPYVGGLRNSGTAQPAPVGSIQLNSSRSNVYRTINPSDSTAVQTCTSGGGTIGKDKDGNTICIKPVGMKGDFSRGTTP